MRIAEVRDSNESPFSLIGKSQNGVIALLLRVVIVVGLVALLAGTFGGLLDNRAGAEEVKLVENGSFEDPSLGGTGFQYHSSIPGWLLSSGSVIEVMNDQGPPYDGSQYVELDSSSSGSSIYQDLVTLPGTLYTIDFAFSPRPGTNADENTIRINWGGSELATISEDGTDNSETDWTVQSFIQSATSDSTRLEFEYAGPANSYGALLDDVQVVASSCTAIESGNWNDFGIWDCGGVPGAGNDVAIAAGNTVSLTSNHSVNNLTIEAGATLDNSGGHTLSVHGNWTQHGEYTIDSTDKKDLVQFLGKQKQTIDGSKDELRFSNLTVDKEKKNDVDLDIRKKLKVEKRLKLKQGKTKVREAEFNGKVEIDTKGELAGTKDKKKIYRGDKTVDGKYTHNQSLDEFNGGKDQTIDGDNRKLEYYELVIKKLGEKRASFLKEIEVKRKTTIDKGKAKVGKATFRGNVEVRQQATLEGTLNELKRYYGNKTVNGKYLHKKSIDRFRGDKDQQISSKEDKLNELLEYHKLQIQKNSEKRAEFKKKLKVDDKLEVLEGKTKVGEAEFKTVDIRERGVLEGTENKTKTYTGDKTIRGVYIHNKSKDRFTKSPAQKVISSKLTKYHELELEKERKEDILDIQAKLELERLRLLKGTLKTNTVFGDVVIEPDAVLDLRDGDEPSEVGGDWTNNGTFHAGDQPVVFNGTEPQSIGGSKQTEFNELSLENDVTISSKVKVNGTLNLSGELSFEGDGELIQGENFHLAVGAGALPGIGCTPGDDRLTGGGWIQSTPGAYLLEPESSGQADFELSVHCGGEGEQPTGNIAFEFGTLSFKASSLDSMIVLGNRAVVAGLGSVNEVAGYGFVLEAVEGAPGNSGDPNKLRMVVWNVEDDETVYDSDVNGNGLTATSGGNIKLHDAGRSGRPEGEGPPHGRGRR